MISHLLQSLPHDNYYKVILCERDLGEVLSSQNVMLQRREQPNPIEDAEARAHYERHLAHIRIFMKVKRNMEFLPVRYDEAIGDPRAFARAPQRIPRRAAERRSHGRGRRQQALSQSQGTRTARPERRWRSSCSPPRSALGCSSHRIPRMHTSDRAQALRWSARSSR